MLTNNFYTALRCCMTKETVSGIRDTDGKLRTCYPASNSASTLLGCFSSKTVGTSSGVVFGTGNTPPTINDYWLSGTVVSTVARVANLVTVNIVDGVYCLRNALTINNTGNESVTIGEMILADTFYESSTSGRSCVYDRTVLDTPLTLAPGEQGVITYTFNLPIVQ